jgi:hypothetical protein
METEALQEDEINERNEDEEAESPSTKPPS